MRTKTWVAVVAIVGVALAISWRNGEVAPSAALAGTTSAGPADSAPAATATGGNDADAGAPAPEPGTERESVATAVDTGDRWLSGLVTDVHDTAMADAAVELRDAAADAGAQPLAAAVTGADGGFRLPRPAGEGPWRIRASAPDHADAETKIAAANGTIHLILPRLVPLFGHVLERHTRTPIAGATVTDGRATVTCDAAGSYEILAAEMRSVTTVLTATAPGYVETTQSLQLHEPKRTELDIEMSPTAPMTVQLVDADSGAPIRDAIVRWSAGRDASERTAADGRFTFDVGEGKSLYLGFEADGYCPMRWSWQVEPGPLPSPNLPMVPVAFIEGTVRDAAGRPLVAQVHAAYTDRLKVAASRKRDNPGVDAGGWPGTLRDEGKMATTAAADGTFRIPVVPRPAPLRATAQLVDCVPAQSDEIVLPRSGDVAHVHLVLVVGGAVRGGVRCNGQPVVAYVRWRQGEAAGSVRVEKGGYALRGLPAGPVELAVRDEMSGRVLQEAVVQVLAGQTIEHDFTWEERTATISGRVTKSGGAPVAKQLVTAEELHATDRRLWDAHTDADGAYEVEVPLGSSFRIFAWHGGVLRERDEVAPGARAVDLVMPETAPLRLRLLDVGTHEPPPRGLPMSLAAWRVSGSQDYIEAMQLIDSTGLVILELPIGTVDVRFDLQGRGYRPIEVLGLDVVTGGNREPVRVDLVRGVELRLAVTGAEPLSAQVRKGHALFVLEDAQVASVRAPLPDKSREATCSVNGVLLWLAASGLRNQMPRFDENGRASQTGLAPGTYRLVAFPDDLVFAPATFTVGPGDTEVELQWRRR